MQSAASSASVAMNCSRLLLLARAVLTIQRAIGPTWRISARSARSTAASCSGVEPSTGSASTALALDVSAQAASTRPKACCAWARKWRRSSVDGNSCARRATKIASAELLAAARCTTTRATGPKVGTSRAASLARAAGSKWAVSGGVVGRTVGGTAGASAAAGAGATGAADAGSDAAGASIADAAACAAGAGTGR